MASAATSEGTGRTGSKSVVPLSPNKTSLYRGSSICTAISQWNRFFRSRMCSSKPACKAAVRSRKAPESVIARWPLDNSSDAARVQGPMICTLRLSRSSPQNSCKVSRSRSIRSHMARDASWGRSVKRHPRGPRSTETASSKPAVRPMASEPRPRAGSCGRCKLSPVSPTIISAARTMSVPGTGPKP